LERLQQPAMTSLTFRLLSSLANEWSENEVDAQQPDGCAGAFAKPEPAFMKGTALPCRPSKKVAGCKRMSM